ncbi:MAG: hypothetical protein ACRCYS_19680 [Beijerinckiaceae bacterium]
MALKLPRLPRSFAIVDKLGQPVRGFQQWWQTFAKAIEDAFNALEDTVAAVAAAQAAADAANAAAAAADAAAASAQSAADDATTVAALTASGVTGATITATDAGANVTVSVTAHTRVYGDGTNVSVNAGSVLAQPYATLVYIYYDDAGRAGGAVTYLASTSQTMAAQTGDRHLVGQVMTPAAAAGPTDGDYVGAPGFGGIYL